MPLAWLDHVNIRTSRLGVMTRFYVEVLGLVVGPRPPFAVEGAWLYCGERAVVHLVETERTPGGTEPRIEHFAFRGEDIEAFRQRLEAHSVAYDTMTVPDIHIEQIFLKDPEGNNIEVGFAPE